MTNSYSLTESWVPITQLNNLPIIEENTTVNDGMLPEVILIIVLKISAHLCNSLWTYYPFTNHKKQLKEAETIKYNSYWLMERK